MKEENKIILGFILCLIGMFCIGYMFKAGQCLGYWFS